MADPVFTTPVSEEDPCGPDFRWDPAFMELSQKLEAAVSQAGDNAVVDGQLVRSDDATFEDVVDMARALSVRTKDLRILAIHAEACWRDRGLFAFAGAMEDLVCVAESWPGHDDGVHPRADPEDGDLSERAASVGKLLNTIPALAETVGWGAHPTVSERLEAGVVLRGVFDAWSHRLEPAFDQELPPCRDAWNALQAVVGDLPASPEDGGGGTPQMPGGPEAVALSADAWDMAERTAELMAQQDRHSPALPVLRLIASWRSLDITEISAQMKMSGVSLEQLLESIDKQLQPPA